MASNRALGTMIRWPILIDGISPRRIASLALFSLILSTAAASPTVNAAGRVLTSIRAPAFIRFKKLRQLMKPQYAREPSQRVDRERSGAAFDAA